MKRLDLFLIFLDGCQNSTQRIGACFQVAISAPSQYKYKLIIKFYNGVFGLSLNRHLKQTAVVKSVLFSTEISENFLILPIWKQKKNYSVFN